MIHHPQKFSVSRFSESCLCPFMLNISLFCYINDFTGADTGTSLLYWQYRTPGRGCCGMRMVVIG